MCAGLFALLFASAPALADDSGQESTARTPTFHYAVSIGLGRRTMLNRAGGTEWVPTLRPMVAAGLVWPLCVGRGPSIGARVHLALASHASGDMSSELGPEFLLRIPLSPGATVDLRSALLSRFWSEHSSSATPTAVFRASAGLRHSSGLNVSVDGEMFLRPERQVGDRSYDGTAVGVGVLGNVGLEGKAAGILTGVVGGLVGLFVLAIFSGT